MKVFMTSEESRPHLSFLRGRRFRLFALVLILPIVQVGFSCASAFAQNIQVTPSALSATISKGQSTTLTLNLKKTGTEQHVWEPKTSVGWISLSPAYASSNTITTELDTVKVTVNTASMTIGPNSGLVYIWDTGPGGARLITVPVTVTVSQSGTTTPPPPPASPPPASPPPVGGITPPPPAPPSTKVATVTWTPNGEADLAGYKLYIGTTSGIYSQTIDVGRVTSYAIALPKGVTYFFALTAYDSSGNESGRSAELSRSIF